MQRALRTIRKKITQHLGLWLVFFAGVLLRIQYLVFTPHDVRSYDTDAHIKYIQYVIDNVAVPRNGMGFEMHQPPLYYFLVAAWIKMGTRFKDMLLTTKQLQIFSLVCSIITIDAALSIACLLFPNAKQHVQRMLFLGVIAVLPAIVFLSSTISNDVLLTALMFAFTASLLDWWKNGTHFRWYMCVGYAIAAILTKLTGFVTVPILLGCLWQKKGIPAKKKLQLLLLALALITICTSWFFAIRYFDGFFPTLVKSRSTGLNGNLSVRKGPMEMLSFSPVHILVTTFNQVWIDDYGRQYFWEFLFKSAFFGEWQFSARFLWLGRSMLLGGLFVLALAIIGVFRDIRRKGLFVVPLLLTLFLSLLSLICFRLLRSAASNQQFRFIPQIIIPIAAYTCMGLDVLPPRWRAVSVACLGCFCLLCGIFLVLLPHYPV